MRKRVSHPGTVLLAYLGTDATRSLRPRLRLRLPIRANSFAVSPDSPLVVTRESARITSQTRRIFFYPRSGRLDSPTDRENETTSLVFYKTTSRAHPPVESSPASLPSLKPRTLAKGRQNMPRRSAASSSSTATATAAASPLSQQQQQQQQPKGKVSFSTDQGPVLRSSAWTSAAQLGSLFAPPSSSSKQANEIDTDSASTLSSTSSFEFDQSAATEPSSLYPAAAAAVPPRRSGSSAYTFHTTPIPPGALVLLAEGKTSPVLSTSNKTTYNGSMAPSRRNASSAAPTPQQQQQSGGRQTKVWAGPKGKMPALHRWRVWYAGVSVIGMLETVRWSSLRFARPCQFLLMPFLFSALCQTVGNCALPYVFTRPRKQRPRAREMLTLVFLTNENRLDHPRRAIRSLLRPRLLARSRLDHGQARAVVHLGRRRLIWG